MNLKSIYKLGSHPLFYKLCIVLEPWYLISSILLIAVGMYGGLFVAPPDYQMGDAFRIIYFHVPSAYVSMMAYVFMAISAIIGLTWRSNVAFSLAKSCAPIGASFTFLALITGMLWGKPMWGTAWGWDARLTSELILLFLYLAYIMLHLSIPDRSKADRATALLAIVGMVNMPIIHYSVVWWNTLHQASTISKFAKPSIATEMLWPLIIMILGYTLLFVAFLAKRTAAELAVREKRTRWLQTLIVGDKNNA
jgi:heme exporter protein C